MEASAVADAVTKGCGFHTPLWEVSSTCFSMEPPGPLMTGVASDEPFPIMGSQWHLGELV